MLDDPIIEFIVPIPPITKKNHQQIFRSKATGRRVVVPSRQYIKYETEAKDYIPAPSFAPIDRPVRVQYTFYMNSARAVDATNLCQAMDDILVAAGLLSDDNAKYIVDHDGTRVYIDYDSPRTVVRIYDEEPTFLTDTLPKSKRRKKKEKKANGDE